MASRKIPDFLTEEEQKALINVFNVRYWTSHRNKTIVQLMLAAGLRISEIVNLKWQNINMLSGMLKVVQGKGKKDRILFINDDMIEVLGKWKERQVEKLGKCDYVFTNNSGKQLVTRDLREMIDNYSKKAGIEKHVKPHMLRHTFGTDLLRATKNLRLVQKALGHSDISTTTIYTHIVDEEYEEALKSFRNKK